MYYSTIHPFFTPEMTWNKTTRTQHDSPKKNQLIGIVLGGQSVHQAGKMVGIPPSSADCIWKKYMATGSTRNLPCSGCPRSVTDKAERLIVRTAMKECWLPFQEIANLIDLKISDATVWNVLAGEGYHWRVACKFPHLCITHKWDHMWWAQKYKSYNTENWGKIIWSDECYIYPGDNRGRIYVTRCPDEEFDKDCLVPTFKQSSVCVMVWGCIMKGWKGTLVVLESSWGTGGGMNTARYWEQVLEGGLKDFYKQIDAERDGVIFQQDGAMSHQSKLTKKWFSNHEIPLLFHPASSPNLSPIELVWHKLKKLIQGLPHPPNTTEQLIAAVHDAWDTLPIADVD